MRPEALEEVIPVQALGAAKKQMCNIGAIVALALHDKSLGPNHIFGSAKPNRQSQNVTGV
jgi:hypothetical protein